MSQSKPPSNDADVNGKPPDRGTRNLNKMVAAFPECPICSSAADYKMAGIAKNVAVCRSCKAGWTSQHFSGDVPLKSLELVRVGRFRKAKRLLQKPKSVGFWQRSDIEDIGRSLEMDVETLLGRSSGRDAEARGDARQALQGLGEIGLIEVRAIADGTQTSPYRIPALLYLASLADENELPIITQALNDDEGKHRKLLIDLHVRLARDEGIAAAVPPVLEVLKRDEDAGVRAHAAMALREIQGDQRAVEALADALHDTGRPPMDLITAGSMTGFIVEAAKQKVPLSVREIAAWSLAEIGGPNAAQVLVEFELEEGLGRDLQAEAELLQTIGAPAVEALIEGLNTGNERTRARAAGFLSFLGDARAVEPLIAALSDDHSLVRSNAAIALGALGDSRAIGPLKLSCDDVEERVRKAAQQALEMLHAG